MADKKEDLKNLPITAEALQWLDGSLGFDSFFSAVSPEGVAALLPSFVLKKFAKGEEIIREGEQGAEMFVLYKGSVKVLRKRFLLPSKVVGALMPGDFFGEVGFLVGAPRSATVRAAEDCQAFGWSAADMQRVLDKNPQMAKKLENTARERIARLAGSDGR